jgi:hypothetical protein
MNKRIKLLLTALIAAITCSIAAGGASANRSIEIRGGPEVQAEGLLRFVGTEGDTSREITCDITLRRTVAAVIAKVRGTLFGKLTGIRILRGETARSPHCRHGFFIREVHDITPLTAPRTPCTHREDVPGQLTYDCSGAEARLWKLIYDSFQGTLPRITGINFHIQRVQFRLLLLGPFGETVECLYEGDAFGLITVNAEGTITRAETRRELTRLPQIESTGLCPERGTFEARFTVRPTLTIRLL